MMQAQKAFLFVLFIVAGGCGKSEVAIARKADLLNSLEFKTTKEPKIGESTAFTLDYGYEAVLKATRGRLLILRLKSASKTKEGGDEKESALLAWEIIHDRGIDSGTQALFVNYQSTKISDQSYHVTQVDGSEDFRLAGLSLKWSFSHGKAVYIYPEPGVQYAIRRDESVPKEELHPPIILLPRE